MAALERLAARLDCADTQTLEALLADAQGMILALTGRKTLPDALETAQVQLAVVLYNRQGAEGETAHAEGGVSRAMDGLPQELRAQIAPYRLARVARGRSDASS